MATGKASSNAIKAGEAFVELFADDSKFNQSLKRSTEKWVKFIGIVNGAGLSTFSTIGITGFANAFGGVLKSLGSRVSSLGESLAVIGVAGVAAFGASAYSAVKYANDIGLIAERTDSSTEAVSRIAHAARSTGIDIEKLEDSFRNLSDQTKSAANGSADQEAAFRKLNISAREFQHLPIDEKFVKLAEGIEGLKDPLDRNRVILALFGEEGLRLLPLLNKGAQGLRDSFKDATAGGFLIKSDDAKRSAEVLKLFDTVLESVKFTLLEVGFSVFELAGDLKEGQRIVLMYVKMLRDWIKENRKAVAIAAIVAAVVATVGVALLGVGAIISIVGGAITGLIAIGSAIVAVLGAITLKVVIVTAVVAALVAGIGYLIYKFFTATEAGKKLWQKITQYFDSLLDTAEKTFTGIANALKKGDLQTAWDILMTGLYIGWQDFEILILKGWHYVNRELVSGIFDSIKKMKVAFLQLFSYIKSGILEAVVFMANKVAGLLGDIGVKDEIVGKIKSFEEGLKKQLEAEAVARQKITIETQPFEGASKIMDDLKQKQSQELDILTNKRAKAAALLDELLKKAAEPMKLPDPGPEVAPMPREKGLIDLGLKKMGDSARGVFQSADYQGSLGLGEANTYAKQAVDVQRGMLNELKAMNTNLQKLELAFT